MRILLVILILLLCFVGLILYGVLLCKIEEIDKKSEIGVMKNEVCVKKILAKILF